MLLSLAPTAVVSAADTAAAVTPTDPRQLQWEDNCVYNCPNEAWPCPATPHWACPPSGHARELHPASLVRSGSTTARATWSATSRLATGMCVHAPRSAPSRPRKPHSGTRTTRGHSARVLRLPRLAQGRDCFHDASECFEQPNGADYRGKVGHTKSGRTCQVDAACTCRARTCLTEGRSSHRVA